MKYLLLLSLLILTSSPLHAKSNLEKERERAKILGLPLPVAQDIKPSNFLKIYSVRKGKLSGWIWRENNPGGNQINTIDVKFKIQKSGEFLIPILKTHLFNKNGFLVKTINTAHDGNKNNEYITNLSERLFPGKRTYVLRFGVDNLIKYKYALVIMGKENDISYQTLRKSTDISKLDFPEKDLLLKTN